jgi:hypothetical protein
MTYGCEHGSKSVLLDVLPLTDTMAVRIALRMGFSVKPDSAITVRMDILGILFAKIKVILRWKITSG